MDIGNTIDYDMKLYQFQTTIVNSTEIFIKGLELTLSHKICWYGQGVCDSFFKILSKLKSKSIILRR